VWPECFWKKGTDNVLKITWSESYDRELQRQRCKKLQRHDYLCAFRKQKYFLYFERRSSLLKIIIRPLISRKNPNQAKFCNYRRFDWNVPKLSPLAEFEILVNIIIFTLTALGLFYLATVPKFLLSYTYLYLHVLMYIYALLFERPVLGCSTSISI
jgi:hypothetical protein